MISNDKDINVGWKPFLSKVVSVTWSVCLRQLENYWDIQLF